MASIREQILAQVYTLLRGTSAPYPTPANTSVFRSREEPIDRNISPAVVVRPVLEPSEAMSDDYDRNELQVEIEIIARGDPWDSLADAIAVPAHRLLMAPGAFDSWASEVRKIHSEWQGHEADQTAGSLIMAYRFYYLSNAADISRGITS